jgi:hypothetical protein
VNNRVLKEIRDYIKKVGILNINELKRNFNLSDRETELALFILEQTGDIEKSRYNLRCDDCSSCKFKSFCFKG